MGNAAARCTNVNTDTGGGLGDRDIQEDYVNHGRERRDSFITVANCKDTTAMLP